MNIDMIRAAQTRLAGHAVLTPILHSPFLDDIAGRRVFVKAECLQHTGSFKFRGAWSALSGLPPEICAAGVIAYSSGNHAQGMALAARRHGAPVVIVMPSDAPALKIANTRALGAEVVLYDRATESREEIGGALAEERDLTLVRPFDEPLVIAGQGSVGLEIAAHAQGHDVTEADVLIPCGGGGLTSGVALALEQDAPGLQVRPVEPQGFDDVARSLDAGMILSNANATGSICDSILTAAPGSVTFPILQRLSGPAITITDEEAQHAMALAFQRLKLVIEPGGAAGLAAALFHPETIEGDTVYVVASGGNVDAAQFSAALSSLG